jgi:hypothetical protein
LRRNVCGGDGEDIDTYDPDKGDNEVDEDAKFEDNDSGNLSLELCVRYSSCFMF